MDAVGRNCKKITDAKWFENTIVTLILINAVVIGLETYPGLVDSVGNQLLLANEILLGVFCVEIGLRILAHGKRPQDFFKRGWNIFDFCVIAMAFLPFVRDSSTLLRLARLLRVARLVSVIPELRVVMQGMVKSIRPIAAIAGFTVFLIYIYGILGWMLFGEGDPEQWGTIDEAALTLFKVLTLESWPEIFEAARDVSPWAPLFFISFVLIAAFVVFNMVIGIVINSLEQAHSEELQRNREARIDAATADGALDQIEVEERLSAARQALDELEETFARISSEEKRRE